jgi:hypothetical protein
MTTNSIFGPSNSTNQIPPIHFVFFESRSAGRIKRKKSLEGLRGNRGLPDVLVRLDSEFRRVGIEAHDRSGLFVRSPAAVPAETSHCLAQTPGQDRDQMLEGGCVVL